MKINRIHIICLCCALTIAGAGAAASRADDGLKTIQNPGGGTIVYGPLAGQSTLKGGLAQVLKQVDSDYGDKPQVGRVLQNRAGTAWEATFTVTAKKKGGAQMMGLAIVYMANGGTAGATLMDTATKFPSDVNSMMKQLQQQMATDAVNGAQGSSAGKVAVAPAQALQRNQFPDSSGVIFLPSTWSISRAQLGDVTAKGPSGETLRFGLTVSVIDPSNPQSRVLMGNRGVPPGNFLAIPYAADPATVYKDLSTQAAQKARAQAPSVTINNTQNVPMQGGKNAFVYGSIDRNDGHGPQTVVAQLIMSPPQVAGAWQLTVFQLTGPPQTMMEEAATVAKIFPNYSRNTRMVEAVANQQIQQGLMEERQFIGTVGSYIRQSNQLTQGMSDYLRGETVISNADNTVHIRTSDDLANALVNANPNEFQVVPTSQYIQGVDF